MKISKNKIVTTTYKLYVGNNELMEEATVEHPLVFIFDSGMMLPKFEAALLGLEDGSTYDFTLESSDAYGKYDEENIIDLPSHIFEKDGKLDEDMVFKGNIVPLIDSEGNHINAQVVEVKENSVTVDFNHPLAGEDLHFVGKVIGVREAEQKDFEMLMGGCGGGCHCGDSSCCSSCH